MITTPIYLDNNATTSVAPEVLEAMLPAFTQHFGNPASKTHSFGWYAEELVEIAREQVADLIGATRDEIVFTSGATESDNLAIKGVAFAQRDELKERPFHLLCVKTEHRAVLDPIQELSNFGFQGEFLDVNSEGELSPEIFEKALLPQTLLASVMLANNEIGVVHDIQGLTEITKNRNILFHCDATQALGKIPVNVKELGVDLLSLSAHKLYGPKGVGALYVRRASPKLVLEPLFHGGGHEQGLRSGTLNVPAIVGLGKACSIAKERLEEDRKLLASLTEMLLVGLQAKLSGVLINGPLKNRLPGNLNLALEGIDNVSLVGAISPKLALSVSSACTSQMRKASHVLQALGFEESRWHSSIRIGLGRFTTEEEVNFAIDVLVEAVNKLRPKFFHPVKNHFI